MSINRMGRRHRPLPSGAILIVFYAVMIFGAVVGIAVNTKDQTNVSE